MADQHETQRIARLTPLDEVLARIDAIDVETVRAVCAEYFAPERQTLLSLGPAPAT